MRTFLLLLLAACSHEVAPVALPLQPSNVYLRNSLDADASSYLGRFVPSGSDDIDESTAMPLVCSQYVGHRFVDGGGVRYTELLQVSNQVAARVGVPVVASASGQASANRVVRVEYVLTGKVIAEISDPAAFAECCKSQPDQCTDRYLGEFLQGTGSVFHEDANQASAKVAGSYPPAGVSGEVAYSHGRTWQRSVEFPNPVYFAFKLTETPYKRVTTTCGDWVDHPPVASSGRYWLGASTEQKTEERARNRALRQAQMRAWQSVGGVANSDDDLNTADPLQAWAWSMRVEESCVEAVQTDSGTRYTAHVLGWLPEPPTP